MRLRQPLVFCLSQVGLESEAPAVPTTVVLHFSENHLEAQVLPYPLPVTLSIGDKVLIEGTGAYTSTYASVAFNGIPPLKTYHI